MKLEYDKSVDAAYLYSKYPLLDGEAIQKEFIVLDVIGMHALIDDSRACGRGKVSCSEGAREKVRQKDGIDRNGSSVLSSPAE